ncbi:MAG: SAV_2336 N-terminal domain-related protein, partial [Cyanobacteriota bacterium]
MVAHSEANPDALKPGPLELAEVLWLARQLPPTPGRRSLHPKPRPQTPPETWPTTPPQDARSQPPKPEPLPQSPPAPADPFLPTPFPAAAEAAPQDTLLPVAVLPNDRDVARDLEGMLPGRVRLERPLGDRDKLLRALAPLLQRRADPRRLRFAEEPTVQLYAQSGGVLQPVFEPSQGPVFEEVLLLCDGGLSMRVWRRQADELQRVVASTQVFAQVRLLQLQPGPVERRLDPARRRSAEERRQHSARRRRAVARLAGAVPLPPGSRPLLLLLSDTAGLHWWDGRMFDALEIWSRLCPTAILQPLPMWHWNRTALAALERVSVRNGDPAAANPAYRAEPVNPSDRPLPPARDLAVPVLPLEREALATWSAVVMGHPAYATAGVALLSERLRHHWLGQLLGDRDLAAPSPTPVPLSAEVAAVRWETFQAMASSEAQHLLLVMASSPLLTLPVIDLLKAAKLPNVASSL